MNREEMRAAIQAKPFEIAPVTVKGWGTLYVRELSSEEGDRLRAAQAAAGESGAHNQTALVAASVLCDETGAPIYDVTKPEDVAEISKISMNKLSKVVAAANALGADETGN